MTKLYNPKNNDMLYFLLFSVVLIPFQFIADVPTRRLHQSAVDGVRERRARAPARVHFLSVLTSRLVYEYVGRRQTSSRVPSKGVHADGDFDESSSTAGRSADYLIYERAIAFCSERRGGRASRIAAGRVSRSSRDGVGADTDVLQLAVLHDDDRADSPRRKVNCELS